MRLAALARQARLQQEAAAVTCLFLGMVLLLSLISYSLPLLGSQPQVQLPAANWCGHFGYYTARYLFSFFGLISFFRPCSFSNSLRLFSRPKPPLTVFPSLLPD